MSSFFSTIGLWICRICGLIVIYYTIDIVGMVIKNRPLTKIKFIEKAVDDKASTLGKISSYLMHRKNGVAEVEYAYKVNDKVYYITYKMSAIDSSYINDSDKEESAETLIQNVPTETLIYYDVNNPAKAMTKREIFISPRHYVRIKNRKKNKYRNISKNWEEPIYIR